VDALSYSGRWRSWLFAVWALLPAAGATGATLPPPEVGSDGGSTRVVVDRRDSSLLLVYVAGKATPTLIRSRQPVRAAIAVDLDGDRRPEIIAADGSRGLHIWTVSRRGLDRPYRPPQPPRRLPVRPRSNAVDDSGPPEGAPPDGLRHALHRARARQPWPVSVHRPLGSVAEHVPPPPPLALPPPPRPPPARP